jgi:hypothetical protein
VSLLVPGRSEGELEALAAEALTYELQLTDEALDEVCDVARRIMQRHARKARALLAPSQQRVYAALTPDEREGMRSAAKMIVLALVQLGHIDQPDV